MTHDRYSAALHWRNWNFVNAGDRFDGHTAQQATAGNHTAADSGGRLVRLQQVGIADPGCPGQLRGLQAARIFKSNDNPLIAVEMVPLAELDRVTGYDLVLFFGRGLNLEPEQFEFLQAAGIKGLKMFMEGATNPNIDVTNLRGRDLDFVGDYIRFGGSANYRSLLNYARAVFDGKKVLVDPPRDPLPLSQDLVFYLDEDALFETVAGFEEYAIANGLHKPGQPRVAMVTSVPGPFNSNRDHVDALIRSLADQGLNVYPMAALNKRLAFLREVNPDAVVFMPHGRITLNEAEEAIAWLRERNIPLFGPLGFPESRRVARRPAGHYRCADHHVRGVAGV